MVRTYKDTPSYRQYLNVDPVTGRGERLDHLMPHLQYNEDGQLIIVPGELFCRWRSDDGALCVKGTALSSATALRKHYHGCHGSPTENRRHGSNTFEFQVELHCWYRAIVNGEMPRWVPRKAADATVAIMPDITSIEEENDDEEKAKEGVNEDARTGDIATQTKKIYKTRMELKKRMERKVMMLGGKLKFKEEMKLKKMRFKKMMKLEKEMKFERMKLRKMRLKKEMRLKEKMKSRR
ncbi:uncharacterized protein TrAtP1_003980 [Trichoderma atroviride]|uniref:uncharacterized protein n=1 Tax=Hypocrea atroviridis TaxID=63577 RepID=UPI0033307C87|nr:hypothetical protein TrAtP1_003980 [Trichoderma atroviride]